MSRWLKPLSLQLALAALILLTAGCGSSGQSQIRMINAIPDGQPADIYINGTRVVKNFTFGQVYPAAATPASYVPVNSGTASVQAFPPAQTTNPVSPTGPVTLVGATEYTVLAAGLEVSDYPPVLLTDDNTPPSAGNVELRIINASLNSPTNGVDVYIVPPGADIVNYQAQISGLSYTQASTYQPITFAAGGYAVIFTAKQSKQVIFSWPFTPQSGSITTFVLMDNAGGNSGMSDTPLVLNDLN